MGSALESPAALFGAAWRAGPGAALDWACRAAAAFIGAAEAGLGPPFTLFVNAEPVSLGAGRPEGLRPGIELGRRRLRVVVEVTERAVAGDPAHLPATVAQAREAGWGVALDDVGAAPASLAVLPGDGGQPRARPGHPGPAGRDVHAARAPGAGRGRAQRPAGLLPGGGPLHLGHPQPVGVPGQQGGVHPGSWATACRSPRWPGSATPTWPTTTRCAASGTWSRSAPGSPPPWSPGTATTPGPDARRGFDVIVTHDRDLVIRAAEPLLRRLVPEP